MPTTIPTQASISGAQAAPDPSCLLEFRNIRIVYDNAIEAIRDVSIAVPEGGIVALLGSNGAGKSTLLKAMSGILYTEEGVIENGIDPVPQSRKCIVSRPMNWCGAASCRCPRAAACFRR